jgi:small subunit ribosomal protein S3
LLLEELFGKLTKSSKTECKWNKIQVSGRLNGAEMARVNGFEKVEFLYKHYVQILIMRKEANTIYGVLGIKVWLFKSEILSR